MSAAPKKKHGGARPGAGRKKGQIAIYKDDIRSAAREHADAALQALVDVCESFEAPPSSRVSAAIAILDRGFGKPIAYVERTEDDSVAKSLRDVASRNASAAPIREEFEGGE